MLVVDWSSLEVKQTLRVDPFTKYIALLVNVKSTSQPTGATSVLLASQVGFDSAIELVSLIEERDSLSKISIELLDENDIYLRFLVKRGALVDTRLTLIHPATPSHIAKYSQQDRRQISETPELYFNTIKPWILKQSATRIRWIDNILLGISEKDRVVYNNPDATDGFVILPDSKWDQISISSLYLLVLVQRRDIQSIRDLSASHLPLLKNIRKVINEEIPSKYPVSADQLRIYVHYPPTYFYFHIHIVHVNCDSSGCAVGGAHLLDDIIDNIENFSSDYYQRRTLHYFLGTEHELYKSASSIEN